MKNNIHKLLKLASDPEVVRALGDLTSLADALLTLDQESRTVVIKRLVVRAKEIISDVDPRQTTTNGKELSNAN